MGSGDAFFFGGFLLLWFVLFVGGMAGLVLGIVAMVSAAQTPNEAFGPWWDNTKTAWLLGIAISYLIPFGLWVTAIHWFRTGKRGLERDGVVGRPFWSGPVRPYPQPTTWYPPPWPDAGRPADPPPPVGPPDGPPPTGRHGAGGAGSTGAPAPPVGGG